MKIFKISDDSGFIGIANYDKYKSYLTPNWNFQMIKERIIHEMNSNHILFWATGMENNWTVKIDSKTSKREAFREGRGVIEVTNGRLYLTNYETLTMAAQFEKIELPEKHQEDLYIELENGKYMVKFRQLFNPENYNFESEEYEFEIVPIRISNMPEIYVNKFDKIFWSNF